MSSAKFQCHVVEPSLRRRTFLAGVAGLVVAAPLSAHASASIRIADVADADGRATLQANKLSGQEITLRGYFAPSVRDGEFALFEAPAAPCQLCGGLHDAGANLVIVGAYPAEVSMLKLIEVRGRVAIVDGALRLVAASAALV